MGRGEMPIEPGDSWFSPKGIEVPPWGQPLGGRALVGLGGSPLTNPSQTTKPQRAGAARIRSPRRETAGAKLRRREGHSPDRQQWLPRVTGAAGRSPSAG